MVDRNDFQTWFTAALQLPKRQRKQRQRTRAKRVPTDPPVYVTITAAMAREYDARELIDWPFERLRVPGVHVLTKADAAKVMSDAEYQGDVNGCSGIEGHPPSVKAMYRRLYNTLKTAIAAQTEQRHV
jgi:hypothetical protein